MPTGKQLREIVRELFGFTEPAAPPPARPRVVTVTLLVTIEDKPDG